MFNLFFWRKPKVNLIIIYLMAFFWALAAALPAYVQSSYLENFIGLSAVTWFFIFANLISFFSIIFFPRLIKKFGNYLSTGLIASLALVSFIGLGLSTRAAFIFLFFALMQLSINLVWINMDIFLESFSKDASTGKTRTIYFTIINLAWVLSPNLSAWLISLLDYKGVFLVSASLIIPFLLIFVFQGNKIKSEIKYKKERILKTVREMLKNKNLKGVYWLAALLNVFYSVATVFVPIYLHKTLGFSWAELGLAFSIMLIPFLIVEIPAGIIADKYLGEKEFFFIGFTIIITCLIIFFYSTSLNIWFWAAILFISRIGAALVEAMRESYFFKNVSASDVNKINLFRTATPFGYLLGTALATVILLFLPIQYIFALIALFIFSAFPALFGIKDTK